MSHPARRPAVAAEIAELPHTSARRLQALARLLDNAVVVPGTRFRFGLDALIGLVPGVGDAIGTALSGYIVLEAMRLGVPRSTLLRMLANVGVDTVVGAVPVLGDLFDFGWKSNAKNLALVREHLERPVAARAKSRRFAVLVAAALLALVAATVALGVAAGSFLASRF